MGRQDCLARSGQTKVQASFHCNQGLQFRSLLARETWEETSRRQPPFGPLPGPLVLILPVLPKLGAGNGLGDQGGPLIGPIGRHLRFHHLAITAAVGE